MKNLILLTIFIVGHIFNGLAQSFEETKKYAEQGFADAQYELAQLYDYGVDIEVDKEKAFYWYTKSAEQGDIFAQYNLGYFYDNGKGVEVNKELSTVWVKKAYDNGFDVVKLFWDEYRLYDY